MTVDRFALTRKVWRQRLFGGRVHRVKHEVSADPRRMPYLPYWLAVGVVSVVALSLVLPLVAGEQLPDTATLVATATSAFCLALIRLNSGEQGFMRLGFHAGFCAFFLLVPLLFPGESAANIAADTRRTIGVILIMSVVGFEVAYWSWHVSRMRGVKAAFELDRFRAGSKMFGRLIFIGAVTWLVYEIALSTVIGVNIVDMLLAMRTPIEGAKNEVDDIWRYGLRGAMGMFFLGATAACVTVVDVGRRSTLVRFSGWAVIGCLAMVGFLTGSRGYFLFCVVPAAVACSLTVLRLPRIPGFRSVLICAAALGVVGSWILMSVFRDADLKRFEGTSLVPIEIVQGAFDIYSQIAVVVEAFPRVIDYQYGASAVPVVFGWVPRAVWPQKPYPFSLAMNHLEGEDLGRRSASLAPGLPAEGYGNFGMPGVLLWVVVMGVFCRAGDDYLRNVDSGDPLGLQLGGIWSIWAALIVRGGVAEMFYMGLEVTVAPLALALFVAKRSHRLRHPGRADVPRRRFA